MTKEQWVERITSDCKSANTYKLYFDSVIDTLAQILEMRDTIHQQFVDEGSQATIIVTTDRSGKENVHKNPLISMETELNSQALKYWIELGLTAAGLKKLNVQEQDGSLEDLLKAFSNG